MTIWDIVITGGVLIGLAVMIISKLTGMTLKDMIIYLKETISGVKETGEDTIGEVFVWNE